MSEKVLTRTVIGEKAWLSLPLPSSERRLLALVKKPLPEHAVKALIGTDPLLSTLLLRGWLKWEGEDYLQFPSPSPTDPPSSITTPVLNDPLKHLHDKLEKQEETSAPQKDDVLKERHVSEEEIEESFKRFMALMAGSSRGQG